MTDFEIRFDVADTPENIQETLEECMSLLNQRSFDFYVCLQWADKLEYLGEINVDNYDDTLEVAKNIIAKGEAWLNKRYGL